jgi:capsid protein
MSYGAFANDRSDSSYSAERSSQLDERLSYQGQQNFINEKMNDRLAEWFVEGLFLAGIMIMPAYEKDPDAYTDVEWQNPGWTWVDPANDSKAANMDLANCTTTRRRIAGNRGDDWDETMDQLIREEDRLIDLARKRAERLKIEEAVNA